MKTSIITLGILLSTLGSPDLPNNGSRVNKTVNITKNTLLANFDENEFISVDSTLKKLGLLQGSENIQTLVEILVRAKLISFPNNLNQPNGCMDVIYEDPTSECNPNFYIGEFNQNKKLIAYLNFNENKIKTNLKFINQLIQYYNKLNDSLYDKLESGLITMKELDEGMKNDLELNTRINKLGRLLGNE